jgi:hypothetical protein
MRPVSVFTVMCIAALGAIGCNSGPLHDLDVVVDCDDLCDRYASCFDSEYDTASCRDRCHDVADRDPNSANECDTCLDARSCSGSFPCADYCYGLIP